MIFLDAQVLDAKIRETSSFLKSKTQDTPQVAVVLGSGLSSVSQGLSILHTLNYQDVPHFSSPSVMGHSGQIQFGTWHGLKTVVLKGRIHAYEGHPWHEVVHPIRSLAAWGAKIVIVTNAAGGLNPKFKPSEFMLIEDHINMTGGNPLLGPNLTAFGPRFPDMSFPYDRELTAMMEKCFHQLGLSVHRGVYVGVLGPSYETAAEIRAYSRLGGDAVGMSTVAEVIAARHAGLRVLGLSCITNLGTGLSPNPLTHEEVQQASHIATENCAQTLNLFFQTLSTQTLSAQRKV